MFGIFIKNLIDEFNRYGNVQQYIAANFIHRKGFLIIIYKYIMLFIKSIYCAVFKDYDIIHAHFAYPTGLIAYICKLIKKKKLIISIHGSDIYNVALRSKLNFKLCKFALMRSDFLIVNSEYVKKKIIKGFGINKNKIKIISIGVRVDLFKPMNKEICRKKLGLGLRGKIILFAGNIIEIKGVIYLIEAINLVRKKYRDDTIKCILLGAKFNSKYVSSILKKIKIFKLEDIIKLVGPVPYNEVPFWINASDVFVLPSLSEGFGLAALEALACRVPVVAARVGGLKEFIKDGETGFTVEPGNSKSIADIVTYILDSGKKDIIIIEENGLKFAQSLSTINQIKKIEKIYSDLM